MKILPLILAFLFCAFIAFPQQKKKTGKSIYEKQNLVAWCIVPYDSKKRNAAERAAMLNKLGIQSFAYDWRANDLPLMEEELNTLRKTGIGLKSVWFWINGGGKEIFDESNEVILSTLKKTNTRTELWVSFPENYFEVLSEEEKIIKAVKVVRYTYDRAAKIGCTIALYNHGAWFGEPANQVKVIRSSGLKNIGIVYNFHHAHLQLDAFDEILKVTKPYLSTVNLDGIRPEGPKILTLGEGTHELEMMKKLKASGFKGSIGIIGHTENEDVEDVLMRNMEGMKKLLATMNDTTALKTYD
jgi:hypothetical protein